MGKVCKIKNKGTGKSVTEKVTFSVVLLNFNVEPEVVEVAKHGWSGGSIISCLFMCKAITLHTYTFCN